MEKRYLVELTAYIYAESEEDAKAQAEAMAEKLQEIDDNRARAIKLSEFTFGSLNLGKEITL